MLTRRQWMQSAALIAAPAAGAAAKPNVVIIFCDDLGYGDLGSYGGPVRTPNLDRIGAEGMRFTNHISANPVCSPSRAALISGRYPTRVFIPRVLNAMDNTGLPESETTLAQVLKSEGYRTMCVGKWHLGHHREHLPTAKGFDSYFGIPYSNDMKPTPLMRDAQVLEEPANQATLTQRYTEEALKFIAGAPGQPFFLYLPHTFPHIPLHASERFRGKSPQGLYGDVLSELDWSAGEILNGLKKRGLDRNTLVIFSSDNGPWFQGSPGRLRGRKGMVYEGGVRVPMMARMPGRIAAGGVSQALTSTMDFFPTVAALCGAKPPAKALDGVNLWPLLSGKRKEVAREPLLYFDGWNIQCARNGNWKLHVARWNAGPYDQAPQGGRINLPLEKPELYNLATDPEESYDVAPENPKVVEEIQGKLARLLTGFPAEVQKAWADTQARRNTEARVGATGRLAKQ